MIFALFVIALSGHLSADEYQLSDDPRLAPAKESFMQAERYVERGDKAFRGRPGLAQKMYEHAEDYYLKARFLYEEMGQDHGIDTSKEVTVCDRMQRAVHVSVNDARNKARSR